MKQITTTLQIDEIRHVLSMDLVLVPFRANAVRRQMMWLGLGYMVKKAVFL